MRLPSASSSLLVCALLALGGVLSVTALVPLAANAAMTQVVVPSRQQDVNYDGVNINVSVLVPKYWYVYDRRYLALQGDTVQSLVLIDQAELNSPTTRGAAIIKSTGAEIFGLPASVVGRLSQSDLVNFYLYKQLKTSLAATVSNAGTTMVNGTKAYFVEWSYAVNGLRYMERDYFIFDGATVYEIQTVYPSFSPDKKAIVDSIAQSLRIRSTQ